jgi:hypothetical protein
MYTTALLVLATLAAAKIHEVTYANFATHEANIASNGHDLSAWGYSGGQLPKVYKLGSNKTFDYMPERSYEEFKNILTGKSNFTAEPAISARTLTSADQALAFPRGKRGCQKMNFKLEGDGCEWVHAIDCVEDSQDQCYKAPCRVNYITVYFVQDSFITFWQDENCNGKHASFNPICANPDSQFCAVTFQPISFATKPGCHDGYASEGCQ